MELLASRLLEHAAAFDTHFLERLETIGHEAGAKDIDTPDALAAEQRQHIERVRLQPFAAPESRLERERPLLRLEADLLRDKPRGHVAMAVIRITGIERALGHAVERKDQPIGPSVLLPIFAHGACAGADVMRIVMERIDETHS